MLGRLVGVRNVYIWVFSLALDGLEVTRLVVRPSMTPKGSEGVFVDWSVSLLLK